MALDLQLWLAPKIPHIPDPPGKRPKKVKNQTVYLDKKLPPNPLNSLGFVVIWTLQVENDLWIEKPQSDLRAFQKNSCSILECARFFCCEESTAPKSPTLQNFLVLPPFFQVLKLYPFLPQMQKFEMPLANLIFMLQCMRISYLKSTQVYNCKFNLL